ncbi:Stealth CR1 domain-containing protein [Psychrobacter sp. FDAARGOS_221]|uniref:Stealth CR1 domain-containing protein n=1 Tax=Psychrobacter sp. FDAARGOS_221 TaxID=1975705 RepID=UPI000BB56527|nr:Stealth CR1 domain-containing protein [Psychrobacter sp. FDAARGOS_221]PNK59482.1 capsular polysaccharide biosynthesis protein [Psychrobacter sp. FDAARGOS_221]
MSQSDQKFDLVLTWVDGDDPVLNKKRAPYLQQDDIPSNAISPTRFNSVNEIYYNVASILKYVPFCRHIYIVTDGQKPKFIDDFVTEGICDKDKIQIIDHKQIFDGYEQYLPTFNSLSIETMLWNIPGLTDYFISLDDDFFFNSPAQVSDFIDSNGNIIIRGHWRKKTILKTKLKYRTFLHDVFNKTLQPKYTTAQMLGAEQVYAGNKFFEIHHYPHINDKQTIKSYLLDNPKLLKNQIKHKFRDINQFDPVSLMNHIKIKQNQATLLPNLNLNYLKNDSSVPQFLQDLSDPSIKYGCIQSMDQLDPSLFDQVSEAMNKKLESHLPSALLANS